MFISFNVLAFLAVAFFSTFLPGIILSFSIFRKDDFSLIEKLLIGCALGFVLLPLIPFLLYFIAGITYTYSIALLSTALLYVISLAFLAHTKAHEDLLGFFSSFTSQSKSNSTAQSNAKFHLSNELLLSIALVVIILLSYVVRV
ncbi:hypothetical protein HZC07_03665, partial [Candidatus Micrarchaeota archaeon]|nr:hypothetical protein [Candidatus Micrarchaeota archaeon]